MMERHYLLVPCALLLLSIVRLTEGVPMCSSDSSTCSTDADCGGVSNLVCRPVGPPENPGPLNCLCDDGYYGDPQDQCFTNSWNAPIFGMYMGCYPVNKTHRVITQAAGDYRHWKLNTYSCRETCSAQGAAFAVLQEGDVCFCADNIDPLGDPIDDALCNSNCTEEDPEGKTCGGFHDIQDGVITESYSSIYTTQKGVSSAFFTNLEKTQVTGIPARAELDYVPPSSTFCKPYMNFAFDFGTGAGFSYPHPHNWANFTYAIPGTYIVTGQADGRYPPLDATRVTVLEPTRKEGMIARCEEYYRFGMKSNCSVASVIGTGLQVDIYWGDMDRRQFEYSRIEDPYHCIAGDAVPEHINCAAYRPVADYMFDGSGLMLVNPEAEFSCEGIIKGFEYFVKGSGTVKFKLFRPACDLASEHYCFDDMICVPKEETCLPPFSFVCAGAYCQMGGGCAENQCARRQRRDAFGENAFVPVDGAEWTVTLAPECNQDCGCHGVFEVPMGTPEDPDHFRVYPGWIVVMEPGTARVQYHIEEDDENVPFTFAAGSGTIQNTTGTAQIPGMKWAFRGFLAQYSAINLTNMLPQASLTNAYNVEIWVTADILGDSPDVSVNDTIDGVFDTYPAYYFNFEVFVHEGFDNVIVTQLFEFQNHARVGSPYLISVGLDNEMAYGYNVLVNVSWGDGSADVLEEPLYGETVMPPHIYTSDGQFEVCVSAYNMVSHDTDCYNLTAMYPVLTNYAVDFNGGSFAIGSASGPMPHLGDGSFTITVPMNHGGQFPTNAMAWFVADPAEGDSGEVGVALDDAVHDPENLVLAYTYSSPGCRSIILLLKNTISVFQQQHEICVYERLSNIQVVAVDSIAPDQLYLEEPEISTDVTVCEADGSDCKKYLSEANFIRFTVTQDNAMINQTFKWTWNDDSEVPEEIIMNSPVALHQFVNDQWFPLYYVDLNVQLEVWHPLDRSAPINIGDIYPMRIAVPPKPPVPVAPGGTFGIDEQVEVTFDMSQKGWKTCCFTYCDNCQLPFAFLLGFVDLDDETDDTLTDAQIEEALERGYGRCESPSWTNELSDSRLKNYRRLDQTDGIFWEGFSADEEDSQPGLISAKVLPQTPIKIPKKYTTEQISYALNYLCWNPLGYQLATFEFTKKNPVDCYFPTITIDNVGPELFNPNRLYRKDTNILKAVVVLNCPAGLTNEKVWRCRKYSELTGQPKSEIFVPQFSGNTTSELVIPAKGLDYDVYRCSLTVKMKPGYSIPVYANEVFTYIKFEPYAILGMMYAATSKLELAMTQSIELSPETYSKDLDLDGGYFIDFKWYCRCGVETYPRDLDGNLIDTYPPPEPLGTENIEDGLKGGCEGLGPGRIDVDVGTIVFAPMAYAGVRVNSTCEIMATFRKYEDPFDRTGVAIISIDFVPVQIPTFIISTGNGTRAEPIVTEDGRPAQKINPIGTFRSFAECTGSTDCSQVLFTWELFSLNPEIVDPDKSNLSHYLPINLTRDAEIQPDPQLQCNPSLKSVGVPMGLLEGALVNGSLDAILRLTVCNMRTQEQIAADVPRVCSSSRVNLRLNEPPAGGIMEVIHEPVTGPGNCLENYMYHTFNFSSWYDPDDDTCKLEYQILQLTGVNSQSMKLEQPLRKLPNKGVGLRALYSGPDNPKREKISFGKKEKDWNTTLCGRVKDCMGAFTYYCTISKFEMPKPLNRIQCSDGVPTVTTPAPTTTINPTQEEDELLETTAVIRDALMTNFSKNLAEGSPRNISIFVMTMSTTVNAIAEDMEAMIAEEDEAAQVAGSQQYEGMTPEEVAEAEAIKAAKAAKRKQVDEEMTVIKQDMAAGLATTVQEVGITSPEIADSLAGSIEQVCNKPKQLSEEAMGGAKTVVTKLGSSVLDMAADMDQGSLESVVSSALGTTFSLTMGARDKLNVARAEAEAEEVVYPAEDPQFYGREKEGAPPPLSGSLEDWGSMLLDTADSLATAAQMNKAPDEVPTELATTNMGIQLDKQQAESVTGSNGKEYNIMATGMKQKPRAMLPAFGYLLDPTLGFSPTASVALQNLVTPSPPVFGTAGDYVVNNSTMIRIVFSDDNTKANIKIPHARKSIDMHIPKDDADTWVQNFEVVPGWIELGTEHQFVIRSLEIEQDVAISIYAKYTKQMVGEWLCVYVRYGEEPFHDPYLNTWQYDFFGVLPRQLNRAENRRHTGEELPDTNVFFIENHLLKDAGVYYVGIRPCRQNPDEEYFSTAIISNKAFIGDFEFNVWTQSCLYMEETDHSGHDHRGRRSAAADREYKSKGCVCGSISNGYQTECMCNHLTSFAGSMAPPPPALDFSAMSFKWEDMFPVYTVLICLWIIYILILLWARRQDKKDLAKLGFTPLPDNNPNDFYMYELAVQTGMVRGAGTRSVVYFYVVGELGRSQIHILEDPYRKILQRDSKDLFLLATPKSLGKLLSIRCWHDNSGVGQDQNWFCDYWAMRDVQTGEKTFFMAYKWWSLINDDGLIDRTIDQTPPENMKQFRYMFASKTREKLNDGHLYYSIFARPVESHFTRVQRCSCAMVILLLEFCVSAMYYQTNQEVDQSSAIWVGPIKFNLAEMGVSLMSTLFVLPPSLLVVQLFRRTKPFTTEEEEDIDELDAEEELENQRMKKKEKKGIAKLFSKKRRNSTESQKDLAASANMDPPAVSLAAPQSSSPDGSGRSEHSASSSSVKSAMRPAADPDAPGPSTAPQPKTVHIKDMPQIEGVNQDDLDEISISESSESEYETDEEDLDLDCFERMRRSRWFCCLQCLFGWGDRRRKKQPFMLPSSFLYINWMFVFILLVGASAVITMYAAMIAFQGGSALVGKWVISMIGSIIMSICLVQPLKILLLAIIISLLCQRGGKRARSETEEEMMVNEAEVAAVKKRQNELEKDQHLYGGQEIGDIIVGKLPDEEYADEDSYIARQREKLLPGQLTRERQKAERIERSKELQMFAIVREISLYLIFTWLLFSVCYIERDTTGYFLYEQVKTQVFTGSLEELHGVEEYWNYVEETFLPAMYASRWYNNWKPYGLFGYMTDKTNLVIGYSILRQIRVKKDLCLPYKIGRHNISRECVPAFDDSYEDTGRYGPSWVRFDANNPYHILRGEYRWEDTEGFNAYPFYGAPYPGGGFIVRLDGSFNDSVSKIQSLRNEKFIDQYTRAIIHEFSVYNPTHNLFAVVTMTAEFFPSSGVFGYFYCDPIRLLMYHGPTGPYQIAVQIGLGLFLVGFFIRDGRKLIKLKKKFFKKTWNCVDLLIDFMGVCVIVVFMYRYTATQDAMNRVSLIGGREFVNLSYLVIVSQVYLWTLGLICFVANMRFLKILNFNKKISMFRDVLVAAKDDLLSFGMMFLVLQAGFVTMAYMFFGKYLVRYRTQFQTQQSLFNMLLGKFSFNELMDVDELLGTIFFMSYSNTMMLITLNVFVVILDQSVSYVNEGMAEKSNEYEIINFLTHRVKYWVMDSLGSAKKTVHDIKNRKEIEERRDLNNKIEDLPQKFNHLLDLINDRYFEGNENFQIQVSDYKDIRQLEKARKRSQKKGAEADDESSDDAMYESMTADFNSLLPISKPATVARGKSGGGSAYRVRSTASSRR